MRNVTLITLLLATLAVAFFVSSAKPNIDDLIVASSQEHNVPENLIRAVIQAESSFAPRAYREEPHIGDASYGLMQVLYSTAKDLGYRGSPEGLFRPDVNIALGAQYLAQQLDRFGDVQVALAAYNAGPTRVARLVEERGEEYEAIQDRLPGVTRAYVARVMTYFYGEDE